jgi:hypothetical protein
MRRALIWTHPQGGARYYEELASEPLVVRYIGAASTLSPQSVSASTPGGMIRHLPR